MKFGIYKDRINGNVIEKYAWDDDIQMPAIKSGLFLEMIDTHEQLVAIEIYRDSASILAAQAEAKIQTKMRQMAISELQKTGELSIDFIDIK